MIKVFCDRCGAEICEESTIKSQGRVDSVNSLVIDTEKTHMEKDLCGSCMKSFDSWWNDTHKTINVVNVVDPAMVHKAMSGGIVLTKEQVRGVTI